MRMPLNVHIDVPKRTWHAPAKQLGLHATAVTDLGKMTLSRGLAVDPGIQGVANGWEQWTFASSGKVVLVLDDAVMPGAPLLKRVKQGIHGSADGAPFTLTAKGAIRSSQRSVEFRFAAAAFRIGSEGGRLTATRSTSSGQLHVATRARGLWVTDSLAETEVAMLATFELAGLDHFLGSPLVELLNLRP